MCVCRSWHGNARWQCYCVRCGARAVQFRAVSNALLNSLSRTCRRVRSQSARIAWPHGSFSHFHWLVWRSGNGVCHINEVKLRRARLVLELVTTFGGSTSPVFFRFAQPGHPSVGRCNEYRRWFRPSPGRNCASEVATLWRFINQFINI